MSDCTCLTLTYCSLGVNVKVTPLPIVCLLDKTRFTPFIETTWGIPPVLAVSPSTVSVPTPVPVTVIPTSIALFALDKVTSGLDVVAPAVVLVVVDPFVTFTKSPAVKSVSNAVLLPSTWFENLFIVAVPEADESPLFDAPTSFR